MGTYIYDQAWQAERERLRALEDLYDEPSTHRLAALGVTAGWRCLEVGCGAGGVARWLAARVGASGQVVATDVDPRFVEGEATGNLEVWRHDIVTDPLEEGAFDLVHARAVLEHVPARMQALARMVAATRPGGWVVVEDVDLGGPMTQAWLRYALPAEHAPLCERILHAFEVLFAAAGADPRFGPSLPAALRAVGLTNVGAELHAPFVWGGGARDFGRLSAQHLRGHMVGAGLVTEQEVERFLALTARADFGCLSVPMVTAWGQRPTGP